MLQSWKKRKYYSGVGFADSIPPDIQALEADVSDFQPLPFPGWDGTLKKSNWRIVSIAKGLLHGKLKKELDSNGP